jgi:hypothetical protein
MMEKIKLELEYVRCLLDAVVSMLAEDEMDMATRHILMASKVGLLEQIVRFEKELSELKVQ